MTALPARDGLYKYRGNPGGGGARAECGPLRL